MVHLIVLQNKSAELVVSLARKRKKDFYYYIYAENAENLNYSLCRQGNTKQITVFFLFFFCSYEVSFFVIIALNITFFSKFLNIF